jgi:arylsulfatase A-like enzyme
MAYYYANIEHIDMQVGRMIDLLKRKDLYQDTLIVFTGDHGEYLGFHHLLLKGGYMYDPLVRVPLIIKFPHRRRAADVSEAIVSNIDLAPTLLLQAGCQPAPSMRGMDLNRPTAGRDAVFAESGRRDEIMVRTKRYKLIRNDPKGGSLFFDLARDPLEMENRIDDPVCRNEVEELTTMLTAWRGLEPCPETYLDENAPVIAQPNVPVPNDGHREEMIAYFAEKMRAR